MARCLLYLSIARARAARAGREERQALKSDESGPLLRDRSGKAPEDGRRCSKRPAASIPAAWMQMRDLLAANPALRKRVVVGAAAMGLLVLVCIGGAFPPSGGRGPQPAPPAASAQAMHAGSGVAQQRLPASPLAGRSEDEDPLDPHRGLATPPEKGAPCGCSVALWRGPEAGRGARARLRLSLSLLRRFVPGARRMP